MNSIERGPAEYQQLEQLVGEPFLLHDSERHRASQIVSEEARIVANDNPLRFKLFASAARSLVRVQHGVEPFSQRTFELIGRRLQLLNNLASYIESSDIEEHLFDNQQDVFTDIYTAIASAPQTANDGELPGFAGYIESPPATGKTAMYVRLAEAIAGKGEKKLKTLIITPSDIIQDQAAGKVAGKGFDLLDDNSELKISSKVRNRGYPLDGDVDIINFQALTSSEETFARVKDKDYDLIICDEAHRNLGPKTQERLKEVITGKVAIGFTATSEYAQNHHVENLFPHNIHTLTYREAAEMRLTQPVHIVVHDTGSEYEIDTRTNKYSEIEYTRIMNLHSRNLKGVEKAKALVGEGLQGIVSCIPGNNMYHAKHMAGLLSAEMMTLADGTSRNIVAQYIDSSLSPEQRKTILEQYERGDIDVLCYVNMLNEGFDAPNTSFLINLRPTDSPVLAKQRAGRVGRLNGTDRPNIIIEFIDRVKKLQYTALEAYDLSDEELQQRTVATGARSSSTKLQDEHEPPRWLQVSFDGSESREVYETYVRALVERAPDDYISIRDASALLGASITDIGRAVKKLDIEARRFRGRSGHVGQHLDSEQLGEVASFLESALQIEEDEIDIHSYAHTNNLSATALGSLVRYSAMSPSMELRTGKRLYRKRELEQLVSEYEAQSESNQDAEETVALGNFIALYSELTPRQLLETVQKEGIAVMSRRIGSRNRLVVSQEDAARLDEILPNRIEAPADWTRVKAYAKTDWTTDVTMQAIGQIKGLSTAMKQFGPDGTWYIKFRDPEHELELEAELKKFIDPNNKEFESLDSYRKSLGMSPTQFERFMRRYKPGVSKLRSVTNGNYGEYVSEYNRISVESRVRIAYFDNDYLLLKDVVEDHNLQLNLVNKMLEDPRGGAKSKFVYDRRRERPVEVIHQNSLDRFLRKYREYRTK